VEAVIEEATVVPATDAAPASGDLLVFVHGYNNGQDAVMERHRLLRADRRGSASKGPSRATTGRARSRR